MLSTESKRALPKEYRTAYSVFLQCKSHFCMLPKEMATTDALLSTNFMASSREPFTTHNLPKGSNWDWAQSSAKARIIVDHVSIITFRKLNTRKKMANVKAPSFKCWVYELETIGRCKEYFLWCEKGLDHNQHHGINTEIGYIFPSSLSASDFSFLAPFVDKNVAYELGWSKLPDY